MIEKLSEYGIEPEDAAPMLAESRETELLNRVKTRAQAIIETFGERELEPAIDTIAGALDPKKLVGEVPAEPPKETQGKVTDTAPAQTPESIPVKVAVAQPSQEESASVSTSQKPGNRPKSWSDILGTFSKSKSRNGHNRKDELPEQQMLPGMEESSSQDVIALLKKRGVKYIDKRRSNGALWIIGGSELRPVVEECLSLGVRFNFKENGGKITGHKPSWWAK